MLEAADEWPGLVLTDLQMPGLSGTALARRLRESSATVRLLAMSGSLPADGALECFDGFLRKPFSMAALAAAIAATAKVAEQRAVNASATPPSPPVLDSEVYRKLESAMKPEKLTQLYTLCLEDVRRRVGAMRIAADSGDDRTYRRAAHAIKGGCGMVGALELQSIAASEENAGIPANHVATLHEFLKATQRLEGMLVRKQ
jgi:CheY-like chemotaxis protein